MSSTKINDHNKAMVKMMLMVVKRILWLDEDGCCIAEFLHCCIVG
jgi:hypothetical protein